MINRCTVVLCVWVFSLNSIKQDVEGKHHHPPPPPELSIRITFFADDPNNSMRFFNEQLSAVYEDLTKCVNWDFHPVFIPNPQGPHTTMSSLYGCADMEFYSQPQYNLGKFYLCMMASGEALSQAETCTGKAGLDWVTLLYCNPLNLIYQSSKLRLTIEFNNETSEEAVSDLKNTACKKLKEIGKPCACCPP